MPRKSAGILLFKIKNATLQLFLVHPGGPFWAGKDTGAWSIPKGEFSEEEDALSAAKREFYEETGTAVDGHFIALSPVKQKAGKIVYAWALEGDIDEKNIQSNSFKIEWPYKSGKWQTFPEVDMAGWFNIEEAKQLINMAQVAFIDELVHVLFPK